ncbi:S-layer homology domain-containing protein [Paenibacillus periandrae]|uniref:S-layer homology domain-containing protein n=1 Tax=Paenibacillus periandrae TaxID=1761741 RepID=UPI001F097C09|nr:S-layer homology domain-containing protein [Paenibacillus periandrae]
MTYPKSNVLHRKAVSDRARAYRIFKNKIKLMVAVSLLSILRKLVCVITVVTVPFSLLIPSHIGFARSNETVVVADSIPVTEPGSDAAVNDEEMAILFSDITGHWAEAPIREATANGFIAGYADGTFKPDQSLTLLEFATLLTSSLSVPILTPGTSNSAPSVETSTEITQYNGNIQSLRDVGIIKENEFTPDQWNRNLTRSVLMSLSLRAIDPNSIISESELEQRAVSAGLLDGSDSTITGTKQVQAEWAAKVSTRAEAVVVMLRLRYALGLAEPNREAAPY